MSNLSIQPIQNTPPKKPGIKQRTREYLENNYYCKNAMTGWSTAGRLSKEKGDGRIKVVVMRFYGVISNTKVRKKDILPAILGLVTYPLPIPFISLGAVKLGYKLNKVFKIVK